MKPNKEQLEFIQKFLPDRLDPQKIWDYVEGELNKIYPLPQEWTIQIGVVDLECRHCEKLTYSGDWHQETIQNVTQLTCPECGAIHSEMIKGDDK